MNYRHVFVAAAALALAACGTDNAPQNLAAEENAANAQVDNVTAADAADANAVAPAPGVESAMPVPGSNVQEKEVYRLREPRPRPKEEAPPPDPHAGHDMNNMADMQH